MEWNKQQQQTLQKVDAWLKDPSSPQVFRLFGFAGTGKTTLAKHFASGLSGDVKFAAYTGKAAHVLRQKGCPGASTIHSLIYRQVDTKDRTRLYKLREQLAEMKTPERIARYESDAEYQSDLHKLQQMEQNELKNLSQPSFVVNEESMLEEAELLILDECSMVGETVAEDLLSYGVKILALGDPFQLPPVMGGGYFTNVRPDWMLTDVVRQAKDNPVLWLATQIRENSACPDIGAYGESLITNGKPDPNTMLKFDQLLVGKNKTRRACNTRYRQLLGFEQEMPEAGDKLVCLRNNHDLGLLNGSLWRVDKDDPFGLSENDECVLLTLKSEDEEGIIQRDIACFKHCFRKEEKNMPWWERNKAEEFDFGYALTVHKSQGSQWPAVVVFDEGYVFRQDKWRWLYTAVTRASEKVTIVKT